LNGYSPSNYDFVVHCFDGVILTIERNIKTAFHKITNFSANTHSTSLNLLSYVGRTFELHFCALMLT